MALPIAALTIYDMLKPIDNGIEITSIKLESKHGGKRDFRHELTDNLRSAVIVCSDSVSKGVKHDTAGKAISEKLKQCGITVTNYEIIADEFELIQEKAKQFSDANYALVIFTGGTGLSPRDVTPEAIRPLLSREIPGVMEAARNYGQQRMPYAMLSRGVAGFIKNTLVLTLPGSSQGASETMDALFPYILHVFQVAQGMQH
jgi:molybdenum cofactor synthesis domain-containing protein